MIDSISLHMIAVMAWSIDHYGKPVTVTMTFEHDQETFGIVAGDFMLNCKWAWEKHNSPVISLSVQGEHTSGVVYRESFHAYYGHPISHPGVQMGGK